MLESQPLCPTCKAKMYPKRNESGTNHWWECDRVAHHHNGISQIIPFDIFVKDLSSELLQHFAEYQKEMAQVP